MLKPKRPLSGIFLFPGLLLLACSFFSLSMPGDDLVLCLVGIVLCLPNIALSQGWIKWCAVGLLMLFVIASWFEHLADLEQARREGELRAVWKIE